MNFKQATDVLMDAVTLEDLAMEMGVSVQTLRQARAKPNTTAHRTPPAGWQEAASKLAESKASEYKKLARELKISAET